MFNLSFSFNYFESLSSWIYLFKYILFSLFNLQTKFFIVIFFKIRFSILSSFSLFIILELLDIFSFLNYQYFLKWYINISQIRKYRIIFIFIWPLNKSQFYFTCFKCYIKIIVAYFPFSLLFIVFSSLLLFLLISNFPVIPWKFNLKLFLFFSFDLSFLLN